MIYRLSANSLVDSGGLTFGSMASMAFRGSDPIVSGEPEAAEPEAAPLWLKGRSTLPMVSVEELNTTQEPPHLIFDPFVFFLRMVSYRQFLKTNPFIKLKMQAYVHTNTQSYVIICLYIHMSTINYMHILGMPRLMHGSYTGFNP